MAVDNGWRKLTGSVLDSKKVLSMTSECFLMEGGSVWCTVPLDLQLEHDQCNWNTDLEDRCGVNQKTRVVTLQQVIGLPSPAVSLSDDDFFKQASRYKMNDKRRSWTTHGLGSSAGMMQYMTAAVVVRASSCQIHLQTH